MSERMNRRRPVWRRALTSVLAASVLLVTSLAPVPSVEADNTVSLIIEAGPLTASIAHLVVLPRPEGVAARYQDVVVTIEVDDSTGSSDGWNAQIAFADGGRPDGDAHDATIIEARRPVLVTGAPIHPDLGPFVPTASFSAGPLSSARTTMRALAGGGDGVYRQELTIRFQASSSPESQNPAGLFVVIVSLMQ